MKSLSVFLLLVVLSFSVFAGGQTEADQPEYPDKNITLLVARNAGGGTDRTARIAAMLLESKIGVPVVVVNRPGADGVIGLNELAATDADGYTVGVSSNTVIAGHTYDNAAAEYEVESFEYLAGLTITTYAVILGANSEFENLDEMVEYGRANPGSLVLGLPSSTRESVAALESVTGVDFTVVVNAGGGANLAAIAGGHVDVGIMTAAFVPQADEQGLTTVGLLSGERLPNLPDTPTFSEQGYDVDLSLVWVMIAPAGLPTDVLDTLKDAVAAMGQDPAFNEEYEKGGFVPYFLNYEEINRFVERSIPVIQNFISLGD